MAIPKTIEGRELNKFVDSPTRDNGTAIETTVTNTVSVKNISPFGKFDKIEATYPANNIEVYTYSLSGSVIGFITATYTDNKKNTLVSMVYDEL